MIKKSNTPLDWLMGLVAVGFDLEEGQVIRAHYPGCFLSQQMLKYVVSVAFPDTCTFSSEGEMFFFFKLHNEEIHDAYCYALFTQLKDPNNPRGYFQSSVVIVSKLKAPSIMKSLLIELSRSYLASEDKMGVFETFYKNLMADSLGAEQAINQGGFKLKLFGQELKVWTNQSFLR